MGRGRSSSLVATCDKFMLRSDGWSIVMFFEEAYSVGLSGYGVCSRFVMPMSQWIVMLCRFVSNIGQFEYNIFDV